MNILNSEITEEEIDRINLDNIFNDLYYSYENEGENKYIKKNDNFYKQVTPVNIYYILEDSELSALFNNLLKSLFTVLLYKIMFLFPI